MLINYAEVQDRRRLSEFHLVFQHWPHMAEGSRVFTGPRRFPFVSGGVFVERTSQTTVAHKPMICSGCVLSKCCQFFRSILIKGTSSSWTATRNHAGSIAPAYCFHLTHFGANLELRHCFTLRELAVFSKTSAFSSVLLQQGN